MDADNLVRMANQIGAYFGAFPDPTEAEEAIATHIAHYWAPRMRIQVLKHLDAERGAFLPLVARALATHRTRLTPAV